MTTIKTLIAAALVAGSAGLAFAEGVDRQDATVYDAAAVAMNQRSPGNYPTETTYFQTSARPAAAQNVGVTEPAHIGSDN